MIALAPALKGMGFANRGRVRHFASFFILPILMTVFPASADLRRPILSEREVTILQIDCMGETHAVLRHLGWYQRSAAHMGREQTDLQFQRIRSELGRIERENPRCFPVTFNAYVTGAIMALHPRIHWPIRVGDISPDPQFRGLFYISALLAQQQVYQPLTPELRGKWGGLYGETVEIDGRRVPRVMGAYACGSTTIWLDPELRPLDLGATALHEIDHLFRDKFGNASNAVEDELLASLRGSWAQFRLKRDSNRSEGKQTRGASLKSFRDAKPDLHLFLENGPLQSAWKRIVRQNGLDQGADLESLLAHLADEKTLEHFEGAVENIARAYSFEKERAKGNLLQALKSPVSSIDPLSRFEAAILLNPPQRRLPIFWVNDSELAYEMIFPDYFGERSTPEMAEIFRALQKPSPGCEKRIEEERQGTEGGRPGTEGGRPGTEGGRPGSEGGRPCLRLSL